MPRRPTADPPELSFGQRLRKLRDGLGLSLREVERRSGINSGYLSQLERDEIARPSPAILQKLAETYDEPVTALMRWVGYVQDSAGGLSHNQVRALKYLGEDP